MKKILLFGIVLLLFASFASAAIDNDFLEYYYSFDTIINYDESGNERNGTNTGGILNTSIKKAGASSGHWEGAGNFMTFPTNLLDAAGSDNGSISLWLYTDNMIHPPTNNIFGDWDVDTGTEGFNFYNNGGTELQVYFYPDNRRIEGGGCSINNDQWDHYFIRWTLTTLYLYQNNVTCGQVARSGSLLGDSADTLALKARSSGEAPADERWLFDEVCIWSVDVGLDGKSQLFANATCKTAAPPAGTPAGLTLVTNLTNNVNATNNPYFFTINSIGSVIATTDVWNISVYLNGTLNQTLLDVPNLNTTNFIINLTYGNDQVGYDVNVSASHGFDAANSSFVRTNIFLDSVPPVLSVSASLTNNSIYYRGIQNISFRVTGSDANLFAMNTTIYQLNGDGTINQSKNNTFFQNITGTSYITDYNGTRKIDITKYNWLPARYELRSTVWDSHTTKEIKNYTVDKQANYLMFENAIKIQGDAAVLEKVDYKKKTDRYIWEFKFNCKDCYNELNISSNSPLTYLSNSKDNAHFVDLLNNKWIDFNSEQVNDYIVTKIDSNTYNIKFYNTEKTIFFESIGDLNTVTKSYFFNVSNGFTFYAQDAINSAVLSNFTVSIYNGSQHLQTKQTLSQNLTFNITSGAFLTNISAAGYSPNSTSNITFSVAGSLTYNLFAENSLYLFFYDESTNELITNNVSVDIIGPNSANNHTTTTGSIFISGFSTGDYTINYNGVAYQQNAYFTTIATSTTQQLNLYLVDNSTSSLIVFSILDEKSNPVSNGTLKRQRFIVPLNAWVLVGMSKTDSNGETGQYLVPNDVFYKFIVENSAGLTIFAGSQQQIYASTVFLRVPRLENILTSMRVIRDNLVGNLSYNNNTQIVSFTWNEPTGLVINGCIDVLERNAFTETVHGPSCVSSNSGTVQINLTSILKNNTQYLARAYVGTNTTSSVYHVGFIEIVKNEPWKRFGKIGLFVSYIFIASMFLLGIPVNFSIALVYSIMSMLVVQVLGISFFSQGAIIIISVIGFIIAVVNKI